MSLKRAAILYAVAIALTMLAYLIDNDPPYDNPWATGIEAAIISVVMMGFVTGIYFLVRGVKRVWDKA